MIADLNRTEWVPASEVHAGDNLVDWHDENGRGVFGHPPRARHVCERTEHDRDDETIVEFVLVEDGVRRRLNKKSIDLVEVQR